MVNILIELAKLFLVLSSSDNPWEIIINFFSFLMAVIQNERKE